jgi:hypothetical protein
VLRSSSAVERKGVGLPLGSGRSVAESAASRPCASTRARSEARTVWRAVFAPLSALPARPIQSGKETVYLPETLKETHLWPITLLPPIRAASL